MLRGRLAALSDGFTGYIRAWHGCIRFSRGRIHLGQAQMYPRKLQPFTPLAGDALP